VSSCSTAAESTLSQLSCQAQAAQGQALRQGIRTHQDPENGVRLRKPKYSSKHKHSAGEEGSSRSAVVHATRSAAPTLHSHIQVT